MRVLLSAPLKQRNNPKTMRSIVLRSNVSSTLVGADGDEGPPVPFPNTVVKLVCVDNTRWATAREDR